MATETLAVKLCAPERRMVELSAQEIILPGEDGVFTVLPAHTALLSTLQAGVLMVYDDQAEVTFYALSGGFAEVRDDRVTVLADTLEAGQHIDLDRAQAARERAEQRLAKPGEETDVFRAELALHRALARISAHQETGY